MTEQDKKNIYSKLTDLLTLYCNTCLDKHQKEKILMCAFKLQLIEYAEANDQNNVDELWESLARTLGVKLGDTNHAPNNKCNCVNGICSLC